MLTTIILSVYGSLATGCAIFAWGIGGKMHSHYCPACQKGHFYEMHLPSRGIGNYWPSQLTTGYRGEVRPVFGPGEERWAEAYDNKMGVSRDRDEGST